MKALVSIITPLYNSELFISETITSVLNQTYSHWELLLIDDGSTDATCTIVNNFVAKYPNIFLLINDTNRGAGHSRNRGIQVAKGDFIAFLDADDLWKPEKLDKQVSFLNTQDTDICFSSYELINEASQPLNTKVEALPILNYAKLLKSNYIGNLTGMYNAKTLGKVYMPLLRKRQDWVLWLNALERSGKPALSINDALAYYRLRKASISASKWRLIKYNYWVYKKGLGYSIPASILKMIVFLYEHFLVKSKQNKTI
ncbi:glycosyltransferase family 2 protein [Bizionia gelidisalsuginis]|uniref:Glycosyltransferase family 2 protein n=2 Tax=Bizionia TaxID=283785 RepID=A0A8H2LEB8_9FLAO|nr:MULTISPECIES: glycosyltransferase family 2 protein [Bizionia]TYB74208.1 glycosyltransferase family 2 protein [Bizionia saleffrena]TYC15670.1 glycosyltransferase family 2 protein [Bizionia gelidisalsuginis]